MSNLFAVVGLAIVGLAISGSALLAISYVERGLLVPVVGVFTLATVTGLWFLLPLRGRSGNLGGGMGQR
jgi:hypothetical protein